MLKTLHDAGLKHFILFGRMQKRPRRDLEIRVARELPSLVNGRDAVHYVFVPKSVRAGGRVVPSGSGREAF